MIFKIILNQDYFLENITMAHSNIELGNMAIIVVGMSYLSIFQQKILRNIFGWVQEQWEWSTCQWMDETSWLEELGNKNWKEYETADD